MARVRVSTTVDEDLLASARRLGTLTDTALVDEALRAVVARHRAAEIAARRLRTSNPVEDSDAWGDLASFRVAAGSS